MKRPHKAMMTVSVLTCMMSGGVLLAQQQSNPDATRTRAQAGSVDDDVHHRRPAARIVESTEHSVKAVRSESVVVQAEDIKDAGELVDPAEETEHIAQAPLDVTPQVHSE